MLMFQILVDFLQKNCTPPPPHLPLKRSPPLFLTKSPVKIKVLHTMEIQYQQETKLK